MTILEGDNCETGSSGGVCVSINPAVSDMVMGDLAIDSPGEAFKTFHGGLKLVEMGKKACF